MRWSRTGSCSGGRAAVQAWESSGEARGCVGTNEGGGVQAWQRERRCRASVQLRSRCVVRPARGEGGCYVQVEVGARRNHAVRRNTAVRQRGSRREQEHGRSRTDEQAPGTTGLQRAAAAAESVRRRRLRGSRGLSPCVLGEEQRSRSWVLRSVSAGAGLPRAIGLLACT